MNLGKDLINTIRESPKRMNSFKSIASDGSKTSTNLRPLCPTRWTMRASSMDQILTSYQHLLRFFEEYALQDSSDAASKCAGYLEQMSKFKHYFLLNLYVYVMKPVEEVNTKIQSPNLGATEVTKIVECLTDILSSKRSSFNVFWQRCTEKKPSDVEDPVLPRQRFVPKKLENSNSSAPYIFKTPEEFYKHIYIILRL